MQELTGQIENINSSFYSRFVKWKSDSNVEKLRCYVPRTSSKNIIPEIFIRSFPVSSEDFCLLKFCQRWTRDRSRYDKTSTKSVMKKLIGLEILKCWTLLFILVTYQVNVYFLASFCKHWEKPERGKLRNIFIDISGLRILTAARDNTIQPSSSS